jgi:hypothetical protein
MSLCPVSRQSPAICGHQKPSPLPRQALDAMHYPGRRNAALAWPHVLQVTGI